MMSRIDPIVLLLSAMFCFSVLVTVGSGILRPDDSVIFTWAAGLSTGILGMIALRIKPSHGEPGEESTTKTETVTKRPPEPPTA